MAVGTMTVETNPETLEQTGKDLPLNIDGAYKSLPPEEQLLGLFSLHGINPICDWGDEIDELLDKYGSVENINKIILFARLVGLKLDEVSDFFCVKKNLEDLNWVNSPNFDPYVNVDNIVDKVIGMDKKFLVQLRKLLWHMTLFEFSLFTVIKNWALSDGSFDYIFFIIKWKEEIEWQKWGQNRNDLSEETGESSDWHENKKKIWDALMSYYLNKMSMSKCLVEGGIKDKIVWLKKIIEKNGKFTDDVLNEENFKDFMQWYRNRKIVTLLCNMCWREGSILLENDKKKVGLGINFDEYF